MGPWSSDGTFGYCSVPVAAVEKAVKARRSPISMLALARLKEMPEQTRPFIELLETSGPALIERIVAAYRGFSLELTTGTRLASKPPKRETGAVLAARAAG